MEFDLQNVYLTSKIVGLTVLVGLANLPITLALFKHILRPTAFIISAMTGLLALTYTAFLAASINLIPLGPTGQVIIGALLLIVNGIVFFKNKVPLQTYMLRLGPVLIAILILWLTTFILLSLKAARPEIYGIERFMDYGFVKNLFSTQFLPAESIWFAGESLNYYYFGHMLIFSLISYAFLPIEAGFYVIQSWVFGMLLLFMMAISTELLRLHNFNLTPKKTRYIALYSGLIAVFSGGFWSIVWQFKQWFSDNPEAYWYAEVTRIIKGTITEMPFYSYVISDLHAHTLGLLMGSFGLLTGILIYQQVRERSLTIKQSYPLIALAGVILGWAFMVNAWDVLTLGSVLSVILISAFVKQEPRHALFIVPAIGVIAILTAAPWYLPYEAPVSGIGINAGEGRGLSQASSWLYIWGPLFTIIVVGYLLAQSRIVAGLKAIRNKPWNEKLASIPISLWLGIIVVAFWIFMELFFLKDILNSGESYRANTVFKITSQVWVYGYSLVGVILVLGAQKLKSIGNTPKYLALALFMFFNFAVFIYPYQTTKQALLSSGQEYQGADTGFNWLRDRFPDDYVIYTTLNSIQADLPEDDKIRNIIEAEGESYTDSARMSTALGWPTIIGFPVHEWTWRGSYDEVGARREEVKQVYKATEVGAAELILNKYQTDYLIVGELEHTKYPEIDDTLLKSLGNVIVESGNAYVVQIDR